MVPENEKGNEIMDEVIIGNTPMETIPEVELTVEESVVEPVENVEVTEVVTKVDHFITTVKTRTFIREEANKTSKPVCVVNAGARLTVNPAKSTDDYYRVSTEMGIGGFCEKKFVTVK